MVTKFCETELFVQDESSRANNVHIFRSSIRNGIQALRTK